MRFPLFNRFSQAIGRVVPSEFRRVFTEIFQRVNELDSFGWPQDFGQFFHILSVHAEYGGDEVAAFRRQVDYSNSAIGSALHPGYQTLFVKTIERQC